MRRIIISGITWNITYIFTKLILIHVFHEVCFMRTYNQVVITIRLHAFNTLSFSEYVGSKYFFLLVAVVDDVFVILSKMQMHLPSLYILDILGNE
jgi:hypothetical protein